MEPRFGRMITAAAAVALGMTVFCPPAQAAVPQAGRTGLGFFGGIYLPGSDSFKDSETYGVRLGYAVSERLGFFGSLAWLDTETDVPDSNDNADLDVRIWDFYATYTFMPEKRLSIEVGGGAGFAFANGTGKVQTPTGTISFEDAYSDSFTLNAVLGFPIGLGDARKFFLVPSTRFRWFEQREEDAIDQDVVLTFVWVFGK